MTNVEDLTKRRIIKQTMDQLGLSEEELAAFLGETPAGIRESMLDALERNAMYYQANLARARHEAEMGFDPERCYNGVCEHHREYMEERVGSSGIVEFIQEREPGCREGAAHAQGCLMRMTEPPPNSLMYPSCEIPSHAEALRMLSRAGLLEGDESGEYNGTDFYRRQATHKLWFAYVDVLLQLGKIPFSCEESPDQGDVQVAHQVFLREWLGEDDKTGENCSPWW